MKPSPRVVGNDLVFSVRERDGGYYVIGLPDEHSEDTLLLSFSEWGEPDNPSSRKRMNEAVSDLWEWHEGLAELRKGYRRVEFVTRFGRFVSPDVDPDRDNPAPRPLIPNEARAVRSFEGFHAYEPKKVGQFPASVKVPELVYVVGPCEHVTYRSDKWNDGTHDYIHEIDSYPRVRLGLVASGEGKATRPPARIKDGATLVAIRRAALGFAYTDLYGESREVKLPSGYQWFWHPGRALFLIRNGKKVEAVLWGGKLNLEDRGIVG